MSKLCENITALVQYGLNCGLIDNAEKIYATNLLMDMFNEEEYEESAQPERVVATSDLEDILKNLLDIAVERELIPDSIVYRDLFDTKLMNCLMPRPSQVQAEFGEKLHKIRKELNLSQEEMAVQTNVTYRAYTSYERGDRKPSFEFLEQLASRFEVNLNWLIANLGNPFSK